MSLRFIVLGWPLPTWVSEQPAHTLLGPTDLCSEGHTSSGGHGEKTELLLFYGYDTFTARNTLPHTAADTRLARKDLLPHL